MADREEPVFYSTSRGDDILEKFIKPELKLTTLYCRSTGDFSSSFLISAAEMFADYFSDPNKTMKIICCHRLQEKDYNAIKNGYSKIEDTIENDLFNELKTLDLKIQYLQNYSLDALEKLISEKRIELRIVIPKTNGIYHQKFGILYQPNRTVAFHGGFNLSYAAHEQNSESSITFKDPTLIKSLESTFNTIWNNESDSDHTYDFPEACSNKIITTIKNEKIYRTKHPEDTGKQKMWNHQREAYEAFIDNNYTGIVQMATGTGKTLLAINCIQMILSKFDVNCVIIVAGKDNLLNQWNEELLEKLTRDADLIILQRYGKYNTLNRLNSCLKCGKIIILTTYGLLNEVESQIKDSNSTFIVCDEVHNLGAEKKIEELSGKISRMRYRLGLSATPERMFDEEGTDFIKGEVGEIIFEYHLEDALRDGILCPFNYYPIRYSLTETEKNKVTKLVRTLNAIKNNKQADVADLRRQISDVYKKSVNKYDPFDSFISKYPDLLKRTVIFTADKDYAQEIQKILLKHDPHCMYHTFYDEDPNEILEQFSRKELDLLITCDKISEGISISDITNIILFSADRSDTKTLQRIGRCLRKDKNNPEKIASIIDFVDEDRLERADHNVDYDRYCLLSKLAKKVIE